MKIVANVLIFVVAFFTAQTLSYLCALMIATGFGRSASYFSPTSLVISFVIAIWWLKKTNNEVARNTKLSAERIIGECENITLEILSETYDGKNSDDVHMLVQSAVLEAVVGGSYTIPSGMNRDILRCISKLYENKFGIEYATSFLDCHEYVQYHNAGSNTPGGITEASISWLQGKLVELFGNQEDRALGLILDSFNGRSIHIIHMIYCVSEWIKKPENCSAPTMKAEPAPSQAPSLFDNLDLFKAKED